MRTIVIGLILAAVVLAGGTAWLLSSYLDTQEANIAAQAPKEPSVQVLVANANMPAGTVINASNVTWQGWPEDGVREDFITEGSSEDPVGDLEKERHVVRYAFFKGDPIIKQKLHTTAGQSFMRGTLKAGMRAVSVTVSPDTASSGFILPGDRIDIILSHTLLKNALGEQGNPREPIVMNTVTETILENILVLAIDQQVSEFEGGAIPGKNLLLEVTPKDAEKIITAKSMGKISVLLRSLESVEKYEKGQSPGYTTDVEVSPTLSSIDMVLEGRRKADGKDKNKTAEPAPYAGGASSAKVKIFK